MVPLCLITGCDLVSPLRPDTHYHGDLWELGDVYIFNAVESGGHGRLLIGKPSAKHLATDLTTAEYFERRGVFVIPKSQAFLSPAAEEYINA
jgi:hypothetical protein